MQSAGSNSLAARMRQSSRLARSEIAKREFVLLWALCTSALILLLSAAGLAPRAISELGPHLLTSPNGLGVGSDHNTQATPPIGSSIQISANPETNAAVSKIIIPSIEVNAQVVLPQNAKLDTLNQALTEGVVEHPLAPLPSEVGNIFLFGHSTGLAVVHNQAYAVFNRLPELKTGQVIRLRHQSREYWYHVTATRVAKADEALIDLRPSRRMLTLSTCKRFGATDDRFIVEADFVKSYPLRS